tara:strand:+ start:1197 stop:2093 length:897 start_codon:yes stop_codon:yes gene_type:complete
VKTIRESTEFGLDMVRGLPTAYYYSKNKIPHKCIVKPTLVDMYKLVSDNVVSSTDFSPNNPPTLYQYTRPHWTRNEWEPPPLKKMFKKKIKTNFNKPTIVINNKFTLELPFSEIERAMVENPDFSTKMGEIILNEKSNRVSTNHYSFVFLTKFIKLFQNDYQIIYISPIFDKTYFKDNNITLDMGDFSYLEKNHPEVYTIKTHMEKYNLSFNNAQFELESTSEKHLTSMGGNCKVSSYFGGDVIIYNSNLWKYGHATKGDRRIFQTGSWLKCLSGASIIQKNSYQDILSFTEKNWKNT